MRKMLAVLIGVGMLVTFSSQSLAMAPAPPPTTPTCPPTSPSGAKVISSCGTTISASGYYIMSQDILNCAASPAITITADCVTLDFNGHTLAGTAVAPNYNGGNGIHVAPVKNLMIKNGTIKKFLQGIVVLPGDTTTGVFAKNVTITNMVLQNMSRGMYTRGPIDTFKINYNYVGYNTNQAIYLFGATNGEIRDNDILYNGKENLSLTNSSNVVIEGNRLTHNVTGVYLSYSNNISVYDNGFCNNWRNMWVLGGEDNNIHTNNFIKGNYTITQVAITGDMSLNQFDGNYWSDKSGSPYVIDATAGVQDDQPLSSLTSYAPACQ
jgi:parallel beta-helix repeat protein